MIQIEKRNSQSRIIGLDEENLRRIREILRYPNPDWNPNFKKGFRSWKYLYLLDRHTGLFPTGLLSYVVSYLDHKNISYTYVDIRTKPDNFIIYKLDKQLPELRPFQKAVLDIIPDKERGTICLPTGLGKCIEKDSLVLCEKGLVKIKDLYNERLKINPQPLELEIFNGEKNNRTSSIYRNGLTQTVRVETKWGFRIEGSISKHQVVFLSEKGLNWKKLRYLKKGELVAISFNNKMFGNKVDLPEFKWKRNKNNSQKYDFLKIPTTLDSDLSYLFGLLIGDGGLTSKNSVTFTNTTLEINKEFERIIYEKFNIIARKKEEEISYSIVCLKLREYLSSWGLEEKLSYYKEIPFTILQSTEENIWSFISGLVDTDGHINKEGEIQIGLSTEKLIKQLQVVLLNLGIISSTDKSQTDYGTYCYYLNIFGEFAYRTGLKLSLKCPFKKSRLKKEKKWNTNRDGIPIKYLKDFLLLIKRHQKTDHWLTWSTTVIEQPDSLLTRKQAYSWIEEYSHVPEIKDFLLDLFENKFYDFIEEKTFHESETYDFVVPISHKFVANGFYNHNTLLSVGMIQKLGQRCIFVVPSLTLVKQTYEIFLAYFGKRVLGLSGSDKQIVVANYQSLVKYEKEYFDQFDLLIIDESHHSSCNSLYDLSLKSMESIYYRYYLSVGEETPLILRKNGKIICTNFREYFEKEEENIQKNIEDYELEVRSFNKEKKRFEWDSITHLLKHKPVGKKMYRLKTMHGKKLYLTEDHSIYKIIPEEVIWVNNAKRYNSFSVQKIKTEELKEGDLILQETKIDLEEKNITLDLLDLFKERKNMVNLFVNSSKKEIEYLKKSKKIDSLQKYRYLNSKHSFFIPLKYKEDIEDITHIYISGKTSTVFSRFIKVEKYLSWLIGYFLADGWIIEGEKNYVGFAANIKDLDILRIVLRKLNLKYVREYSSDSVKMKYVGINCPWLYEFFKTFYKKHDIIEVPSFVFNLSPLQRLFFLHGYIQGDGHRVGKQVTSCSKSEKLIRGLEVIAKSLNIIPTYSDEKGPSFDGKITQYHGIRFGLTNNNKYSCDTLISNNYKVTKVQKIEEVSYSGYVYDFTVKRNGNFVANNILVSNTATPYRNDGSDMKLYAVIGDNIFYYPIAQAIRDGWIAYPFFMFYNVWNTDKKANSDFMFEYKSHIVENSSRNLMISRIAQNLTKAGRQILILVKEIAHGEEISRLIPGSLFIKGEQDKKLINENFDKMNLFRERKFSVLIATSVIGEGTDINTIDTVINAAGMKARSQLIQKIGRGLRILENKTYALYIDFIDKNTCYLEKHSMERLKSCEEYETQIKVMDYED